MFKDIPASREDDDDLEPTEEDIDQGRNRTLPRMQSVHMPPPKDDHAGSIDDLPPSIIEVLRYIKQVFENESLLDELPIEAAGNPGAWHAWQAHRKKAKALRNVSDPPASQTSTPVKGVDQSGRSKPSGEWNWKGVWVERVKRGVTASLSEAKLYGEIDGDDLVCGIPKIT
jgi:hypothetical protein